MHPDTQKVEHAKALFEEIGAKSAASDAMNRYYDQAMENLRQLESQGFRTEALHALAQFLVTREI